MMDFPDLTHDIHDNFTADVINSTLSGLSPKSYSLITLAILLALVLVVAILICVHHFAYLDDVLNVEAVGNAAVVRNTSGGMSLWTVYAANSCEMLRCSAAAQLRPTPTALNFFCRTASKGLCYGEGEVHDNLRACVVALLNRQQTLSELNRRLKVAIGAIGANGAFCEETHSTPLTLKHVESLVNKVMVEVLYAVDADTISLVEGKFCAKLDAALDELWIAKEKLGQIIYPMNIFTLATQFFRLRRLTATYSREHEVILELLKGLGLALLTSAADDINVALPPRDSADSADIYEAYIETLLMGKKKLGYALFVALKELGTATPWQTRICSVLKLPERADSSQVLVTRDTSWTFPLLTVVLESLRLDKRQYTCHLRKTSAPIDLQGEPHTVYPIAEGAVVHPKRRFSKVCEDNWPTVEGFSPEQWHEEGNFNRYLDATTLDEFYPFGSGERRCPADKFSQTLLAAFIAHTLRIFDLRTETPVLGGESRIHFKPRPDIRNGKLQSIKQDEYEIIWEG